MAALFIMTQPGGSQGPGGDSQSSPAPGRSPCRPGLKTALGSQSPEGAAAAAPHGPEKPEVTLAGPQWRWMPLRGVCTPGTCRASQPRAPLTVGVTQSHAWRTAAHTRVHAHMCTCTHTDTRAGLVEQRAEHWGVTALPGTCLHALSGKPCCSGPDWLLWPLFQLRLQGTPQCNPLL